MIADYLARRIIAVLRVDDQGVGKSTGNSARATIVIKLLASNPPIGGFCNPMLVRPTAVASGLRVSAKTDGNAEIPFSWARLTAAELKILTNDSESIQRNGAGYGICKSCRQIAYHRSLRTGY